MAIAFKRALEAAVRDCYDRPTLTKSRQVSLVIDVRPVATGNVCRCVEVDFQVPFKLPAQGLQGLQMESSAAGHIAINIASPKDINQRTLDEMRDENGDTDGPRGGKGDQGKK